MNNGLNRRNSFPDRAYLSGSHPLAHQAPDQPMQHLDLATDTLRLCPRPSDMRDASSQAFRAFVHNGNTDSITSAPNNRPETETETSPISAFTDRVQRVIQSAQENGQTSVDLSNRAVTLRQLEKYYSLLNTQHQNATDHQSGEDRETPINQPGLIISGDKLEQQLMMADPALVPRFANRLAHLVAHPYGQGGIQLSYADQALSKNAQIERINLQADACSDLSALSNIFDEYRRRFEPTTLRQPFLQTKLQPMLDIYKNQSAHDSVIEELRNLNQFFANLMDRDNFDHPKKRGELIARAVAVFEQMRQDDGLFHDIVMLANTNLDDCVDRRANTLLDMELCCALQRCAKPGYSRENLYEQGLKFLRLHVAEEYAWQHCMDYLRASYGSEISHNSDEAIEVILYLRIHLQDLGLPLTDAAMNYGTSINLPKPVMQKMRQKIHGELGNLATVQNFFKTWTPWLKHLERSEPDATNAALDTAYTALDALETRFAAGEIDEFTYIETMNTLVAERDQAHTKALEALSDTRVAEMFRNEMTNQQTQH